MWLQKSYYTILYTYTTVTILYTVYVCGCVTSKMLLHWHRTSTQYYSLCAVKGYNKDVHIQELPSDLFRFGLSVCLELYSIWSADWHRCLTTIAVILLFLSPVTSSDLSSDRSVGCWMGVAVPSGCPACWQETRAKHCPILCDLQRCK